MARGRDAGPAHIAPLDVLRGTIGAWQEGHYAGSGAFCAAEQALALLTPAHVADSFRPARTAKAPSTFDLPRWAPLGTIARVSSGPRRRLQERKHPREPALPVMPRGKEDKRPHRHSSGWDSLTVWLLQREDAAGEVAPQQLHHRSPPRLDGKVPNSSDASAGDPGCHRPCRIPCMSCRMPTELQHGGTRAVGPRGTPTTTW